MPQLPRHAKAIRPTRRPLLRAALTLPAALGLVFATSAGAGAVVGGHAAPAAYAAKPAVAAVSTTATAAGSGAPGGAGIGADIFVTADAATTPADTAAPEAVGASRQAAPVATASQETEANTRDGGALLPAADDAEAATQSATAPGTTASASAHRGAASTMMVAVRDPGATYVSSSSSDRPLLMFSGWTDAAGRPLGATGSVTAPVQIRIVDDSGSVQSATIFPVFTGGRSNYALPLWPFTQAMEPHVGVYTMQWRGSAQEQWSTVDTLTMDVRLPEPTTGATLTYSDGALIGTGWSFDRSTNIAGTFKVALTVSDPAGSARTVNVRARFYGTRFVISAGALEAAGVQLAEGYTVSATATGGRPVRFRCVSPQAVGARPPLPRPRRQSPSRPRARQRLRARKRL
ncbi:hypothetical protein [Actinomyces sp. 432]|uniref:hypothetical protein n=1 Tax=Actinomyces sp. 432 TaxID=2057798 RepID=UPI00137AE638|nr:hypothetical protein [Actinomyces sp. 432]